MSTKIQDIATKPFFEENKFLFLEKAGHGDVRLILFPFVGGSATAYQKWLPEFPDNIDVYSVQLPGRGNRFSEPLCTNMQDIVDDLIGSIIALSDKPTFFFGHSLGGRIAYECCQYLHKHRYPQPKKVFISASKSPDVKVDQLLCELDDQQLMTALAKHGGIPDALLENTASLMHYMPMIRADMHVFEHYQCNSDQPLDTQLVLMAGKQDVFLSFIDLYGWNRYFRVMADAIIFEGGHFYINEEQPRLIQSLITHITNTKSVL